MAKQRKKSKFRHLFFRYRLFFLVIVFIPKYDYSTKVILLDLLCDFFSKHFEKFMKIYHMQFVADKATNPFNERFKAFILRIVELKLRSNDT